MIPLQFHTPSLAFCLRLSMRLVGRLVTPASGALFGLAAPLAASALMAQQVDLQVREAGSQTPIGGAIVRLLRDGSVMTQGLTNDFGRVSLKAATAGSYRIKVDRIGWLGILSEEVLLEPGQVQRRELIMPATRLELPTIEVRTRSRCGQQGGPEGREILAVWEEIQKALTANLITTGEGALPLHVREFRRWLQRNGTIRRQYHVTSTIVRGPVYASLPPAFLAQQGFVKMDARDSVTYAVPDAALLVSDEFAATHCFGLTPDEEGLVGLTFEPMPGQRLPDVAGTIWVDRTSSELKFLDYRYTGLQGLLGRIDLGGRVEFLRLPSGAWIVSYWHVRTPDIVVSEIRTTGSVSREIPRHLGYVDLGGRVTIAGNERGRVHLAMVRGRVTDGTADGAGLPGALVQVQGSGDQITTDRDGRYELAVSLFGERTITAIHPKLGLLPSPAGLTWVLSLGDTTIADFVVPPMANFVRHLCGATRSTRSGVVGIVLDTADTGVEGLEVRALWRSTSGALREARTRTGRRGLFALCDLPADEAVTIRVLDRDQALVEQAVEVPFRAFTWMDLRMPAPPDPGRR